MSRGIYAFAVGGAAVAMALVLVSCLAAPLSEPAGSKVQQQYVGAWTWGDAESRSVSLIRPWDDRTYVLQVFTMELADGRRVVEGPVVLKGWLTELKGMTFISLQQVETLARLPGEEEQSKPYLVAKLELAGDELKVITLNPSFEPFKTATSPEQLRQRVEESFEEPKAWADPVDARKMPAEDLRRFLEEAAESSSPSEASDRP